MAAPFRVTVRESGDSVGVELPRSLAGAYRADDALGLVAHGADALLLLRGEAPPAYFAGSLSAVSVGELVGLITTGLRTGKLIFTTPGARKTVSFQDGQIAFATSTEPYERLGRSMVRRGLITQAQLERALSRVGPGVKLGQALTSSKVVSPSVLYTAMADLVTEIVSSLFDLEEAHWLFLEGTPAAQDAVKLSQRTQEILLKGMQRGEAVERLRRRFPPDRRLVPGKAEPPRELAELVAAADGGVEVASLRASFEGSEHAYFSGLELLVAQGALEDEGKPPSGAGEEPARASRGGPPPSVELYASLIRTVCAALGQAGMELSDLRSFFTDPLPGLEQAFEGVELSDEGTLDVARVLRNVQEEQEAYEALDSFVSYALFSAKNVLPPDLAEVLGTEFRRVQKGVA